MDKAKAIAHLSISLAYYMMASVWIGVLIFNTQIRNFNLNIEKMHIQLGE